jgi:hypothetical protein
MRHVAGRQSRERTTEIVHDIGERRRGGGCGGRAATGGAKRIQDGADLSTNCQQVPREFLGLIKVRVMPGARLRQASDPSSRSAPRGRKSRPYGEAMAVPGRDGAAATEAGN